MIMLIAVGLLLVVAAVLGTMVSPPRGGLWMAWFASILLAPCWMIVGAGGLTIDPRMIAALIGLSCLAITAGSARFRRPILLDLLVLWLWASLILSELLVGRFSPMTAIELGRRWVLPYLVGRFFLGSSKDIRSAARVFAPFALIMVLGALVESVFHMNPLDRLFGRVRSEFAMSEGFRMGFKRAQGSMEHPIYFGLVQVMMIPWAIAARQDVGGGSLSMWKRSCPLGLGFGLLATLSRGPWVAGLITAGVSVWFQHRRLRRIILVGSLLVGVAAYALPDLIASFSAMVAGETESTRRSIAIDSEELDYTGSLHRLLLFSVYKEPIRKAGFFGFGHGLRGVEIDESLANRFWSIDCHYLLFYLQRGLAGLVPFVAIQAWSLILLGRIAWRGQGPRSRFAGSVFGAILAVSLVLWTVWFAPDFGVVWLFCVGLAGCLQRMPDSELMALRARAKPGAGAPRHDQYLTTPVASSSSH